MNKRRRKKALRKVVDRVRASAPEFWKFVTGRAVELNAMQSQILEGRERFTVYMPRIPALMPPWTRQEERLGK